MSEKYLSINTLWVRRRDEADREQCGVCTCTWGWRYMHAADVNRVFIKGARSYPARPARPGASFINVAYAQKKAYATLYAIVEIYKKQT